MNEIYMELHKLLDKLSHLERDELESEFSSENVDGAKKLAQDILGIDITATLNSPSEFADFIYEIKEARKKWNRIFGDVVIAASESYDKDDRQLAVDILNDFTKQCPSPYLRNMALTMKKDCISGKLKKSDPVKKEWGLKAGETLVSAQEHYENEDSETAISILNNFLKICPVEEYRKDVQSLLDAISTGDATKHKR